MSAPRFLATIAASAVLLAACSAPQDPEPSKVAVESPDAQGAKAEERSAEAMPPPTEIAVEMAGICNIEMIGDATVSTAGSPAPVVAAPTVSGWRSMQAEGGSEAPAWLRVLDSGGRVVFQSLLPATEDRPDVVVAVSRASALRSGFRAVGIDRLEPGRYTVDVVLDAGPHWVRCAHAQSMVVE